MTYNFDMIKDDSLFEMKSNRLIIDSVFSPTAFRLSCVQYGQTEEAQAVLHTKQSAKISPLKSPSKLSFPMVWLSLWNDIGSSYRYDRWLSYRYDGAKILVTKKIFVNRIILVTSIKVVMNWFWSHKIAEMEDCSPITTVLFFSSREL